jgi:hypothetical protein
MRIIGHTNDETRTPLFEAEDGHIYFGCGIVVVRDIAVEAPAAPPATEPPKEKPEEKESLDDIKKRARKPPTIGPCLGCGKNKPLNRLMLCYRCWVNKNNSDKGWKEGQPHPAGCGCDLDCRFDKTTPNN